MKEGSDWVTKRNEPMLEDLIVKEARWYSASASHNLSPLGRCSTLGLRITLRKGKNKLKIDANRSLKKIKVSKKLKCLGILQIAKTPIEGEPNVFVIRGQREI